MHGSLVSCDPFTVLGKPYRRSKVLDQLSSFRIVTNFKQSLTMTLAFDKRFDMIRLSLSVRSARVRYLKMPFRFTIPLEMEHTGYESRFFKFTNFAFGLFS